MPIVRVEMLEGRSAEVKQQLAAEITDSVVRRAGVDPAHVYVMFTDVARSDWAVSGKLFAQSPPHA
jgi:4-oxalocrotonate tautomerase